LVDLATTYSPVP